MTSIGIGAHHRYSVDSSLNLEPYTFTEEERNIGNLKSNILLITSSYPEPNDCIRGIFIEKQVHVMNTHGYNIFVLTPHIPGTAFYERIDGVQIFRFPYFFPLKLERLCGSGGLYFGFNKSMLGKIQIIPYILMMLFFSGLLIQKKKISLIHTHWIIPQGFVGAFWQKMTGIPHLATIHVLDITVVTMIPRISVLIRNILKHTKIVTVNSTFTQNQVKIYSPQSLPIQIIPMGLDSSRISSTSLPIKIKGGHIILFVGRIIRWKGVDTLIQAIHLLRNKYPDVRLIIIGDGPERMRYQEEIINMNLNNYVQFLGIVTDSELNSFYQSSDLFILPSKAENGIVMEGLGIVLIEAIAKGVPVIGSNIGGIIDLIQDHETGLLSNPGDAGNLAEKIDWAFENPEKMQKMANQARKKIMEKYSWDVLGDQFDKVYQQLLN